MTDISPTNTTAPTTAPIPSDTSTHYAADRPARPWHAAWQLIKPYWISEDRWQARGLLSIVIALSLGQVFISVLLNKWNAAFYNALQDKNLPEFWHQLGIFCGLAFVFIIAAVYQSYLRQLLHIRWRRWLTLRMTDDWLARRNYYRLQVLERSNGQQQQTDNPDQRIADDIDGLTGTTLSLGIGLLNAVVTLVSFVTILWGLSGALDFTLLGYNLSIPGYMVWVAIAYALVGTLITHFIGRKLIGLNYEQQRREANFRFGLIRVREHAEPIAFYGGEAVEAATLRTRFAAIASNWRALIDKQKQLAWFTVGYAQIANIFAILVGAPRYFAGAIQLGGLMQTASAFGQVQESLSWLIDVYPTFANWKATVDRLHGFTQALYRPQPATALPVTRNGADFVWHNLSVQRPDGTSLIDRLSQQLASGTRLLITGPSGSGKTTLLRMLAGLWPHGSGSVTLPKDARLLFLPQRPYLPEGSLRTALAYPKSDTTYDDADLLAALRAVGLSHLCDALDHTNNWSQQLSPGEQQKLAFARVLLAKPTILLLDEASAALDEASEAALYQLLRAKLPQTIVVSIGHRESLQALHDQTLAL